MTLNEQLKKLQHKLENSRDERHVAIMRHEMDDMIKESVSSKALQNGHQAPSFHLPNVHGNTVRLGELLKDGPVIVNFYRGSWCPYCNLELRAYQQKLNEIKSFGGQLVAISPELPDHSLSNKEKLALEFDVLSDVGNIVASQFGLVFTMSKVLGEVYRELYTDITLYNGDDSWQLPIPATYLIRTDRSIAFTYVNVDYTKRCDPIEVINQLKSINT